VINLLCGDSVEMMRTMADESVHSIVVDPPYGLSDHKPSEVEACLRAWLAGEVYIPKGKGFMGKRWDAWVPGPEVFREAMRVIKPGGHLLCFAGTRSMDLMCMAIRLAGWELRDSIGNATDGDAAPLMAWAYGSGFPKNLDISKAIDKAAGAERPDAIKGGHMGISIDGGDGRNARAQAIHSKVKSTINKGAAMRGTPVTDAAKQWEGWGTALKPAWEPIILARKPLKGTVAQNVLAHGTAAINIGGCRVPLEGDYKSQSNGRPSQTGLDDGYVPELANQPDTVGRWPANLVHDGSEIVEASFPEASGARGDVSGYEPSTATANLGNDRARAAFKRDASNDKDYEGPKSASRFFYCAKTSAADRHEGLVHPGNQFKQGSTLRDAEKLGDDRGGNNHPTVKPVELMRYLVRLVTPPGGHVLDFTCGSGSTGKASELEGFDFTGIDIDPHNIAICRARIGASAPLFAEFAA
jgi:DNA modification methylase